MTGVAIHIHYRVGIIVVNNRGVTVHEVENHLQISNGSMHDIIRIAHYASQASRRGTHVRCWDICQHCCKYYEMKFMIFLDTSSVWMKHGSITIIQRLNTRVWNRNIHSYQ